MFAPFWPINSPPALGLTSDLSAPRARAHHPMSDLDESTYIEEETRGLLRHFRKGGLASDTAWAALHDVSQLLVMTATFLLLSRQLKVADYGRYAGLYGIVGPIGGLTWSGIALSALQRRLREQDPIDKVARDFLLFTMVAGVGATAVGTLVAAQIIGGTAVTTILAIMLSELVFNAINSVGTAMVQAERGFAPATRLRMVTLAIRITVVLGLAVSGELTIAHLGFGYSIGFFLYSVALYTTILPRSGISFLLGRPSPGTLRTTASISLPIAAGVLQQDGDKAVLNAYGFHNEAGLYAAAFRVISMGLMPLRALEGAAFQRFLHHDENERNQHTRRAARFAVLALGISIVLAIGLVVFGQFLTVLIGEKFAEAESMIPWLLPFLPLTAVANAPANGLLGLGKLGTRAGIYFGGAIVSLTLYITLVPRMEVPWKGAVVGTLVGESFIATAGWVALRHHQRRHNEQLDAGLAAEPSPAS